MPSHKPLFWKTAHKRDSGKSLWVSQAPRIISRCSSPVPQSEKKFFLSVNYLTHLTRFLNDAAEKRLVVETADDANSPDL